MSVTRNLLRLTSKTANLPGASTLNPMDSHPEVVTIGHAIVDVLAPSEDELVAGFGLQKGTMTLVDDARAEKIYASLGPRDRGLRRIGGQHRGLPGVPRRLGRLHRKGARRHPRPVLHP